MLLSRPSRHSDKLKVRGSCVVLGGGGSIEEISSVLVSPFEMGAEQSNSRFVVSQVMLSLLLSWRMS